jgi:hypothetical protein
MIDKTYLETVRDDLLARVAEGSILVNNSVVVPIEAAAIASHPVAGIEDGIALQVTALHVSSVPAITSVKLLTKTGAIVAEKTALIEMNGAQFMNLTFVVQVKGGGE